MAHARQHRRPAPLPGHGYWTDVAQEICRRPGHGTSDRRRSSESTVPCRGRKRVLLGACLVGAGIGCGGSPSPLPTAHSSSFFPVAATTDMGGPADQLEWTYRMNGGASIPLNSTGGITVTYADHQVRVAGTTLTKSLDGTEASTDGSGWAGTVSEQTTEHFSSSSPATVLAREVVDYSDIVATGSPRTMIRLTNMYDFGAMPEPLFFDRPDLDSLAIGFSESIDVVTTDQVSETINSPGSPISQTQGVTRSLSWSLQAVLPTFRVLDKDYADVVQVGKTMTSTTTAGDTPRMVSTIWLAKGIGMIRAETTGRMAAGVEETDTYELASTNLVVP